MSAHHFDNSDSSDEEEAYALEEYDVVGGEVEQDDDDRPGDDSYADAGVDDPRSHLDFRMNSLPSSSSSSSSSSSDGPPAPLLGYRDSRGETAKNTGPKGVKADFEQAKKNLRSKRIMQQLRLERAIDNAINKHVNLNIAPATAAASASSKAKSKLKRKDDSDDSDEDEDQENAREAEKMKEARIAFVQNSLPSHGTFVRVTFNELVQIINTEHELVYIVVHLYQNELESCTRLNLSLEALCKQFPYVHFVRIISTECIPNYSNVGLPTLIVYRNKEMVTSAVRVTDALPRKFSDLDVARLLQSKGILTLPTGDPQQEREEATRQQAMQKEMDRRRADWINSLDDADLDEENLGTNHNDSTTSSSGSSTVVTHNT